jgi:penicillin-binding protein 2
MLIFDQLKRSDPSLRTLALLVLGGLGLLLAGLWYLQVFSSRRYVESQKNQSFRTVRVPAIRGQILDRDHRLLAESRPSYNLNLYLDELSRLFQQEYERQRQGRRLSRAARERLGQQTRYTVASNLVVQVGGLLGQPLRLNPERFQQHYNQSRALPMTVLENLDATNIARFLEQPGRPPGVDLEIQSLRYYPQRTTAGPLLGYLRRWVETSNSDDDTFFNYCLPDFKGVVGVEAAFDQELRGKAGAKYVLVNNLGYRQAEHFFSPAEPGLNLILTIDARIQKASEDAMRASLGKNARAAVVVLDPRNGDLLALASSPSYDPNVFIPRVSVEEWRTLNDTNLNPTVNLATYGWAAPGSIFKIVTALACLQSGLLDPQEIFHSPGYFQFSRRSKPIADTAPPGDYDFRRAFIKSCNTYFIHQGTNAGVRRLLDMGHRFFLGERTEIPNLQEISGVFRTEAWMNKRKEQGNPWREGDTANLSIGQGDTALTPLQVALMTAAVANGGTMYWPRLAVQIETPDALAPTVVRSFPAGRLRGNLGVAPQHLELVRAVMLADVEDRQEGTGYRAFVAGFRVCGKTGTAENKPGGHLESTDAWFTSFAPYESPRYVVVVLVKGGGGGGVTCAPVAQKIYQAIQKLESAESGKAGHWVQN